MKKDLTEMVFILDKSGSMAGLESDTIGGFNSMIEKQKKLEGDVKISTVLFNHKFKVIHNRVDIKDIPQLTHKEYHTDGMTALLDAIGRSIRKIRSIYSETLLEDRPSKVMFVITTDGMENSSTEYDYTKVKRMIEEVSEKYKWEFLFLGANIDAISEARKFGINKEYAVRYHSDKKGTKENFEAINEAMTSYRITNVIKKDWKRRVEEDFEKRMK